MEPFYFYIYVLTVITSLIIFAILKCMYKINYFDSLMYHDERDDSFIGKLIFYLTHFVFYFMFGILFTFTILPEMILKTIFIEFLLIIIKNCNVFVITDIESALLSIIVGILSYICGGLVQAIFLEKK